MKSALRLLNTIWTQNHTTAWEALNHCMLDAANLAVGAKLEWAAKDFDYIAANYRPHYWLGEHMWERVYSLAVWTDGTSFIKAYEAWMKRKPFFANDVSAHGQAQGYAHANSQNRQRGRIALNSEVWIDGLRYECTTIEQEKIILVSRPGNGKKKKILKLSHAHCLERWPAPKKPKKLSAGEEAERDRMSEQQAEEQSL